MGDLQPMGLVPHAIFAAGVGIAGPVLAFATQNMGPNFWPFLSTVVASLYMAYNVYATTRNASLAKALVEAKERAATASAEAETLRRDIASAKRLAGEQFVAALKEIQSVNESLVKRIDALRCVRDVPRDTQACE